MMVARVPDWRLHIGYQEDRQMETRTVEVVLQHSDGRMVARLTVRYPPPATLEYAGQQWHRAAGFGPADAVYRPDQPFARPVTQEVVLPISAVPRRRR